MPVEAERTRRFLKQIEDVPGRDRPRVERLVETLANYPNVPGIQPLHGSDAGRYKIRSGDYRVIVRIEGGKVVVEEVQNRRESYGKKARRGRKGARDLDVPRMKHGPNHAALAVRESLARLLKKARLGAGLTQVALAKIIHRSQSTVASVELARMSVSEAYVLDVLKACGLPSSWKG